MLHDPEQYFEDAFNRVNKEACVSPMSLSPCLSPIPPSDHRLETPRPLRRCRSASPAPIPRLPIITPERQILIKRSWHRFSRSTFGDSWMADLNSRIGRAVFGEDPTSFGRHTRHFMDLLQITVDNLNDLENALRPWLTMLGQGHSGFRIKSKHWEEFGASLMATVTEWVGPGRSHRETVKGWMILSSFLADRLAAASTSSHSPMLTPRLQLMTFQTDRP